MCCFVALLAAGPIVCSQAAAFPVPRDTFRDALARGDIVRLEAAMHRVFAETPTREEIEQIEGEMLKFPQLAIEPRHYFAEGLYAREILIPAGALLTGIIHRTETLNVVSHGEMIVWTPHGTRRVKGPCTFVSGPGVKRIGIALTACLWTAINANPANLRDLGALDEFLLFNPQQPEKPTT